MGKFQVSTDSTSDFYNDEIEKLKLYVGKLNFIKIKDGETVEGLDDFKTYDEYVDFYNELRSGTLAKTSILNLQAHIDLFTKMAEDGVKEALHISQSYGLSPTVDNAKRAIEIVKEKYPDINYLAIESNTTTVGENMIVRMAMKLSEEGKTNAEAADYLNVIKNYIQHFIIVDDIMYLKRGGRISGPKAVIGTVLQVKPIIVFTKDGKLEIIRKEKGAHGALKSVVEDFGQYTKNENFYCTIVHTDNLPIATRLQEMMVERYNVKPEIRIMGPIIGAHVGPNAVALAFTSNEERPI